MKYSPHPGGDLIRIQFGFAQLPLKQEHRAMQRDTFGEIVSVRDRLDGRNLQLCDKVLKGTFQVFCGFHA
jgi:hypothetical protein